MLRHSVQLYHRFLLAKLESFGLSVARIDQVLPEGKNLQGASGLCVVARDKDQEWSTSGVSYWATSFLVVCQRPPDCYQCAYVLFHRHRPHRVNTLTMRSFAQVSLQNLELVGKLGPPYQSHQLQLMAELPASAFYPHPLIAGWFGPILSTFYRLATRLMKGFRRLLYEERVRRLYSAGSYAAPLKEAVLLNMTRTNLVEAPKFNGNHLFQKFS